MKAVKKQTNKQKNTKNKKKQADSNKIYHIEIMEIHIIVQANGFQEGDKGTV